MFRWLVIFILIVAAAYLLLQGQRDSRQVSFPASNRVATVVSSSATNVIITLSTNGIVTLSTNGIVTLSTNGIVTLSTNGIVTNTTNQISQNTNTTNAPMATNQFFFVRGVIRKLDPDGKTATIRHEEIPGYMKPMEMSFEARNTNELRGIKTNDVITFRLTVTDDDAWIDQVKKVNASPQELPSRPTTRIVRDVDPLKLGEPLPNYNFTNEFGQPLSTSQFKGKALAFTFIFTRCPFPTACPKMSSNFLETQKKLASMPNAPTNWHMLTISFDPEFDTPEILKAYAQRQGYDPKRWNFVTGDLLDITALAEQVDLQFWRLNQNEPISHNLRAAVIDTRGRLQTVFQENKWTSDQLVEAIVKAANK
jgi:protein SCO1